MDAVVGESADFECHVTGTQPIKVAWAKDNREIRSGGNYQISYLENSAHLTILKVDKGDSGQYMSNHKVSVILNEIVYGKVFCQL